MPHPNLHIHTYTGRENGIMIIGTKDELAQLAVDLQQSLEGALEFKSPGWPARVLTINGESPFVDQEYPISFHVRTDLVPGNLQERPRHARSTLVFLGIAFFASVGLVSFPIWLAKLFQAFPTELFIMNI